MGSATNTGNNIPVGGAKPRVLLVEPDAVLAQQYQDALELSGWQVASCPGAQEAITSADSAKPDLIVVELLLGGHSGVEFLYEFRSYGEWQVVPALVLSTVPEHEVSPPKRNDDDKDMLAELGVLRYLYKPRTTLAQLCQAAAEALQPTGA